ncbi:MAG: hypothetical protein RI910_1584, partial [Verrucomicrobiota bacterium]
IEQKNDQEFSKANLGVWSGLNELTRAIQGSIGLGGCCVGFEVAHLRNGQLAAGHTGQGLTALDAVAHFRQDLGHTARDRGTNACDQALIGLKVLDGRGHQHVCRGAVPQAPVAPLAALPRPLLRRLRRKLEPNHHHRPLTDLRGFSSMDPALFEGRTPRIRDGDFASLLIITDDHAHMAFVAVRLEGFLPFT